jgi:pantoate--beta-alanine ligase
VQIIETVAELRAWSRAARKAGKSIGLVPTMGALHAGHRSLVQRARSENNAVAVSIFVNPTQFGPNEDFSRYPRTFAEDCSMLKAEGVDVVFAPEPAEIYRPGAATFVEVEGLSSRLDGASRPGHFRGVATVVSKLFIAAEPDRAYFGQKDAAQVAVLRRMTADLDLGVDLVICPIVREPDGLAMSSRNRYLNQAERQSALVLRRALESVELAFAGGERSAARLIELAQAEFALEPAARVDYIAAVDWATLLPVERAESGTLFAVAAWIGADLSIGLDPPKTTRLIDNVILRM